MNPSSRSQVAILFAVVWWFQSSSRAEAPPSASRADQVQAFSLPDQFQQNHVIDFTNAPVRLLTVADQQGSEEMDPWITALKHRFGTNLVMVAVADVSKVPRLLRGFVRGKFVERYPYPVLLDFKGDTLAPWRPVTGEANLYLLATNGRILGHWHGVVRESTLSEVVKATTEAGIPEISR